MFCGFNLTIKNENHFMSSYDIGNQDYNTQKSKIEECLSSYLEPNNKLNAKEIINNWFPTIDANIFISHSHKDKKLAISFSGWLKEEFGLTSFIDSCVWGYSDDLLRKLDDEYCWQQKSETYSYKKRNNSTSHVHTMLTTSLLNMIDNCECLIFLNTPSSISTSDIDESTNTDSPWIFYEIATSKLIRRNLPTRLSKGISMEGLVNKNIAESMSLQIQYDTDLTHLISLSDSLLLEWKNIFSEQRNKKLDSALDILYAMLNFKIN